MSVFQGKRILLGVTGGISAFKAIELLRLLTKSGASVDVVMTRYATEFVGVATMKGLSGRPVILDLFDLPPDVAGDVAVMPHLEVAENADLAIIVPATANTMAKMAVGMADNALSTALLSVRAPVIAAPGMDSDMWNHPATQHNVTLLKSRGVHFVGPYHGMLARGNIGFGRLAEPEEIFAYAERLLTEIGTHGQASVDSRNLSDELSRSPLANKKIIVTAGGTQEPIDPVRFITNRSSGKMGLAIAEAAIAAGAEVTLIHAPINAPIPDGCQAVRVHTALEMHHEVMARMVDADCFVMAAAVSDYRVEHLSDEKIKKGEGEKLELSLVLNPDIASEIGEKRTDDQILVIFAAETNDLIENATKKLKTKNANLVVANDVSKPGSGFDVDTNEVTFVFSDGREQSFPLMSKKAVGKRLIQAISDMVTD